MTAYGSTRKGRAKFIILIIVCFSILACYLFPKVYNHFFPDYSGRPPSPARANIIKIRNAFYAYINAYGTFPYDSRGPDYALYKLKPFVEDVKIFRWPFTGINRIKRWRRPKPRWDDSQGRLLYSDYDYLNAPDIVEEDSTGLLIILAEKTGLRKKGKIYLTKMGFTPFYSYRDDMPKEILGKYADLSGRVYDSEEEALAKSR